LTIPLTSEGGVVAAVRPAGEFRGHLKALSVADVLNFLRALARQGRLTLAQEGVSVGLFLRAGRVIHATSSRDTDRLTEILLRGGALTRSQYDETMGRAAAGERIGKALVSSGAITPRGLLEARQRQVRQIVLSLFEWASGEFAFQEGESPEDEGITVDLDLLDLVVEGIRSVRAAALFRERLPSPEWIFEAIPPGERKTEQALQPHEEYILRMVDGERTVGAILGQAEFPEVETLRILFLLFAIGFLKMRSRAGSDAEREGDADLEPILERYNGMLGQVYRYLLREAGPISGHLLGRTLRDATLQYPVLFSRTSLGGDGTIDAALLRENLRGLGGDRRRATLVQGLNELLYAELLVLRRTLGAEHEGRLLRTFRDQRIRTEAGLRGPS
jgi:hypothetical protein